MHAASSRFHGLQELHDKQTTDMLNETTTHDSTIAAHRPAHMDLQQSAFLYLNMAAYYQKLCSTVRPPLVGPEVPVGEIDFFEKFAEQPGIQANWAMLPFDFPNIKRWCTIAGIFLGCMLHWL